MTFLLLTGESWHSRGRVHLHFTRGSEDPTGRSRPREPHLSSRARVQGSIDTLILGRPKKPKLVVLQLGCPLESPWRRLFFSLSFFFVVFCISFLSFFLKMPVGILIYLESLVVVKPKHW